MMKKTRLTVPIATTLTPDQRRDLGKHLGEAAEDRLRANGEDYGEAEIRVLVKQDRREWYPRAPGDKEREEPRTCTATITIAGDVAESDIDDLRRDLDEGTQTWLAVNTGNDGT